MQNSEYFFFNETNTVCINLALGLDAPVNFFVPSKPAKTKQT